MQNNDTLESALFGFEIDLLRFEADLSKQALASLWQLEAELVQLILNISPTEILIDDLRKSRLIELQRRAEILTERTYTLIKRNTEQELQQLLQLETKFLNQIFTNAGYQQSAQAQIVINDELIIGATLSEWFDRQQKQFNQYLLDNLRLCVLQNKTTSEIVKYIRGIATGRRQVAQSIDPVFGNTTDLIIEYKNGIFDGLNARMETLITTSIQTLANSLQLATYRQNTNIVQGLHALVTLDNKTSVLCMGRSGFEWDINTGKPLNTRTNIGFPGSPPWHWNCRTILIPIFGKPVTPVLTYDDWLNTQTKEKQLDILGNAKYRLWKDKKLNVNELTNKIGRPLTIQQLIQKYK